MNCAARENFSSAHRTAGQALNGIAGREIHYTHSDKTTFMIRSCKLWKLQTLNSVTFKTWGG